MKKEHFDRYPSPPHFLHRKYVFHMKRKLAGNVYACLFYLCSYTCFMRQSEKNHQRLCFQKNIRFCIQLAMHEGLSMETWHKESIGQLTGVFYPMHAAWTNELYRHQSKMSLSKKFTCKGTLRQVFICVRPPPLLGFCLGGKRNFVGSESGQIHRVLNSCRIWSPTGHNTPQPLPATHRPLYRHREGGSWTR